MGRKKEFSKESILNTAFKIACEEGLKGISMRKIASSLGSSVTPLYISYSNRDDLIEDVVNMAHNEVFKHQESQSTGISYYHRGETLLLIARKYPKFYVDVINYGSEKEPNPKLIDMLLSSMKQDVRLRNLSDDQLLKIHTKVDLFIYGITSALYSRLLPLDISGEYLIDLFKTTQDDIVTGEIKRNSLVKVNEHKVHEDK